MAEPSGGAALGMVANLPGDQRVTVEADKNYDTQKFVAEARELKATPQVAQTTSGAGAPSTDGGRGTRVVRLPSIDDSGWKRSLVG